MRNRFKTLLCAAAILSSVSYGAVFADNAISSNIETPTTVTGETLIENSIEVTASGSLTVKNTEGATEPDGDLNVEKQGQAEQPTLTNNGTISVENSLSVMGTVDNYANISSDYVDNMGTINNKSRASFKATLIDSDGVINNSGVKFEVNNFTNSGEFNNSANATISSLSNGENDSGTITTGTINNNSVIEATKVENLEGSNIKNNSGAKITASTDFVNSGSIENNVGAEIKVDDTLTNSGSITNNGTITAETLINEANSTITGDNGKLEFSQGHNDGKITQAIINHLGDSTFENNGEITANEFNVGEDGTFLNSDSDAKLTIGTGTNNGKIYGGIIDIKGDYTNNGILTINKNTDFIIKEGQTISGTGTFGINGTNNGTVNQKNLETYDDFVNNGTITLTPDGDGIPSYTDVENEGNGTFRNSDNSITGTGSITVDNGFNDGDIKQGSFTINGTKALDGKTTADGQPLHFMNQGDINVDNFVNKGNIDTDGASSGSITTKNGSNSGIVNQIKLTVENSTNQNDQFANSGTIVAEIENKDNFVNDGSIIGAITNNGTFTNNNVIGATDKRNNFSNSGTFTNADNANIYANDFVNNATFTVSNNGNIDTKGAFSNEGNIEGSGNLVVANGTNSGNITQGKLTTTGVFTNNANGIITSAIENNNNFTNNGSIIGAITNNGTFTNNKVIGQQGATNNSITNSGSFTNATGGDIYATDISNSGTFENNADISASGKITNNANSIFTNNDDGDVRATSVSNAGTLDNNGEMYVTDNFTNSGSLNNGGFLAVKNDDTPLSATFENTGTIENKATLNADNFTNSNSVTNSGIFNVYKDFTNNNNFTNQNQGQLGVDGVLTNSAGATLINTANNSTIEITSNGGSLVNDGIIKNSQTASIMMNSNELINNGIIENDHGYINDAILTNNNKIIANNQSSLYLDSLDNDNGTIDLNGGSTLSIYDQTELIAGVINSLGHAEETLPDGSIGVLANKITTNEDAGFIGNLNIGDGTNDSYLAISGLNVKNDATVNVAQRASLSVGENATLNLNTGDTVKGDIVLEQGVAGQEGTINLDDFTLETGLNSTLKGGNQAYYSQSGGTLNLLNDSTLKLGDSSAMRGGDLNIDGTSQFLVTSEENGTIDSGNFLNNLTIADGGRFGVMNGEGAEYNIGNINVNNGTANFTIDVLGRSNAQNEHGTDQFIGTDINGNGTINIEDWTLAGDIFGWQAPIDRNIKLDNVFDYQNISPDVKLSATKKEVFTPIGWYQLNNHGGMTGNYELNLTRFNPQVYRGQVTTLSQYMNQLAIDDMLFNHSMLLPSFKDDDILENGAMINRYAAANPLYAPYQYSKKDGGLWYRMYGTFETLQMNQAGLGRVGNNAYGTIIGADFGLKDLKNGWKFMPTAYIGYNGAHQYFAGAGAYQNGGQAGFLGTWYKDNFIIGGLVYGGVYQNSMDIAGHTDNTFNYFAGASAKGAYNWRFHRDWVLQPNLMLAYNFFGQQNWHSDYGQMGMMSGILNGINLAPGLNLIWEKETFSIYATLQYMYNLNGAVGGRAGNVDLPHLYMDRGYIQYGFGFTKRFSDRFSGYFQTVFRNVGRTGVGFQLGLNFKLGK